MTAAKRGPSAIGVGLIIMSALLLAACPPPVPYVPATYAVTYHGNGATGGSVPTDGTSYLEGGAVTVSGNTGNLAKSGHSFSGWNTQADGLGTTYAQGQTFKIGNSDVTLYARWTAATYTVTYDGNTATGGSAPADSTGYLAGQTVTVLGNSGSLVRTACAFTGWNTQADGLGTSYTQGQTFVMGSANVILYARWTTAPTYTVTYSGNGSIGGTVPSDSTNYQQGDTVTVLGNTGTLSKAGYAFTGWNTQPDGLGTTYTQTQTFPMGSANVTLYAKWTNAPTYTVAYNDNGSIGGTIPTDSTNYQQGDTVTVLGNTGNLVRTGYAFTGWNTQADGLGTTYTQTQTFAMGSASVALYAKWTVVATYSVTYDPNGATGGVVPMDSTSYQQGDTVTVLGNTGTLVRTGFTFTGWNTQADGLGTTYTQTQTFVMGSASMTLYAKWAAGATYTVTYNLNGATAGSVPTDSTNYQQGDTVTVLGNTGGLVKTSYVFAGWNTQANGFGITYAAGQTFTMGTANKTLYAKWAMLSVSYNGNGASGGALPANTVLYNQGVTVTVLGNTGNLVKTGYTFAGWNTQADGLGTPYTQGQTFTMGGSLVTLYAVWTTEATYAVTYDGNGATGGSVPVHPNTYLPGQTVTVLGVSGGLLRTGYAFVGWNTQSDGNGTGYTAGQAFTMGSSPVVLYACWAAVPVIVTIAGSGTVSGFSGDGYPATVAQLAGPSGVAVDAAGNLYIADTANRRIRKVDTGGIITTVAGNGVFGYAGDGGPATSAALSPDCVVVDTVGNIYVSDQNHHCVRKVDTSGNISTFAGTGVSGFSGDSGPATAAMLAWPYGLALDASGNLYIADTSNNRIRKVDTAGTITTVAGNGNFGFEGDYSDATSTALFGPKGVAFDASGNMYIADTTNRRVRKVNPVGSSITTVAGNGSSGSSGDGYGATSATLTSPVSVAVDSAGNLYISDNTSCRIRKVDTGGIITTVAGTGNSGFSGDYGPAASANIYNPRSIVVDAAGNVLIVDSMNSRVRKVSFP